MFRAGAALVLSVCTQSLSAQATDGRAVAAGTHAQAAVPASAADSTAAAAPFRLPAPAGDLLSAPGFESPFSWDGGLYGASWQLHEGFNAQLSMSLSAAFGKHAPKGVGFGQSAAFAYALPLSGRFSAAAGVYANNMDWGGLHSTDGGVAAALRYSLTDAVSLYAYGAKSFVGKNSRAYGLGSPFCWQNPDSRVGAMAEIRFGHNAMIQISVERQTWDAPALPAPPVGR